MAIVTPVHNRKPITLQCLRSIERLDSDGLEIRTVVVDDGSTDGTSEAIEKCFPDVEVIRGDGNLWFTEGTNVAIRAALKFEPKYLLLINDDQVFDGGALKFLVNCAERCPRSVVGPLLLLWDQPHKVFQVSPVWDTWAGGWKHWRHQTVWTVPRGCWEVELIVGNCVLVPREAISEAGLMNSYLFPNFGDAEYTPRLKKFGWRLLIEPRARVFCQPNDEPARIRNMSCRDFVDRVFLDRRHPHNLVRRFLAYWYAAPARYSGAAAFAIFLFRAAFGRSHESNWADRQPEKPLSKQFLTFPKCPE